MNRLARLALATLACCAATAHADFVQDGRIYYLGAVPNDTSNPDLRVVMLSHTFQSTGDPLDTNPACGTGTPYFSVLNSSDANYATTAQVLNDAMRDGRRVQVYSTPVTTGVPAMTYCKITYVRSYSLSVGPYY